MKKTLVITHDNCIDGCGCEALLKAQLGDLADYIPVNHHQYNFHTHPVESQLLWDTLNSYTDSRIIMADICLPDTWIDMFLSNGNHVSVIDHHQSAEPYISNYLTRQQQGESISIDILFDKENKQSGSMLTWKYIEGGHLLNPITDYSSLLALPIDSPTIPNVIKYISDGDVWTFSHNETKGFYTYINNTYSTLNLARDVIYKLIHDTSEQELSDIVKIGTTQHLTYMKEVYSLMPHAKPINLFGISGTIIEAPSSFTSTLGNELAKKHNGFSLIVREEADGSIKAGLRSIGDLNVNTLASKFGGGGHKNASGFQLKDRHTLNQLLIQHGNEEFYPFEENVKNRKIKTI